MTEKNIYEELIKNDDTFKVTLPIGVEVEIKNTMTLEEKTAFIDRVLGGVFIGEDEDFYPEYVEPIFQISILQMLTDIPVFEDEGGENVDIEKTYKLCKVLNLQREVDDVKFIGLVSELDDLLYEKINYKKDIILAGERKKLEYIRQEMENGIAMINGIAENLLDTIKETGDLDEYTSELSKLNDSIQNMDEDKLVDSILEFKQKEE